MYSVFASAHRFLYNGLTKHVFIAAGLNPVSIMSRTYGFIFVLNTIGQLSALTALAAVLFVFRLTAIVERFEAMGKLNVALKGASIILTHWIVLADILRTRSALRRVFQNFKLVDVKIIRWKAFGRIRRDQFDVALIVVEYLAFVVISEIIILVNNPRNDIWMWYWYASTWSLCVNRLRHLQNVQLVEELTSRYRAIRSELEHLTATATSTQQMVQCIQLSNQVTEILADINGDISYVFGLSQLANLTQNFVQLSSDLYWMYGMIYSNVTTMLMEIFVGLIQTFLLLTVLMNACEKCMREVNKIGFLVQDLTTKRKQTKQLDILVESYTLQVLHSPTTFSVAGFFNMDFMLLKQMVAAITTYMVIFIQFMPKEEVPDEAPVPQLA